MTVLSLTVPLACPGVIIFTASSRAGMSCSAAWLKVDDGQSIKEVAAQGLLKPVGYETVRQWEVRYERDGLAGLLVRSGRGRKPAVSPCASRHRSGGRRPARGAAP